MESLQHRMPRFVSQPECPCPVTVILVPDPSRMLDTTIDWSALSLVLEFILKSLLAEWLAQLTFSPTLTTFVLQFDGPMRTPRTPPCKAAHAKLQTQWSKRVPGDNATRDQHYYCYGGYRHYNALTFFAARQCEVRLPSRVLRLCNRDDGRP